MTSAAVRHQTAERVHTAALAVWPSLPTEGITVQFVRDRAQQLPP
ncbi:hypothetical protein [Actinomadura gamaensis]|uniref:Uncharacterized protein n=1 Tax=Actinomadura gamaensis TaxID=1763541 RepID=A0ABV9U4R9_9ACTN